MDDLKREYGGWSDPKLSPNGRILARKKSSYFKKIPIDIILTSPLKRAKESASILGKKLKVRVEEFAYLKERNTYGILGGVSHKEARRKYPELVKAYNAQKFIPGAERYNDFKNRIDTLLKKLIGSEYSSIICVTHGYVITTIMEEFLGLNRERIEDGCILTLELSKNKFLFKEAVGLTFSEGERTYNSRRYRKFK